jgi:hypothetical protein
MIAGPKPGGRRRAAGSPDPSGLAAAQRLVAQGLDSPREPGSNTLVPPPRAMTQPYQASADVQTAARS